MTGTAPFTHIAYDDDRVAASDVLDDREPLGRSDRLDPYVIFTDPELGRIGFTVALGVPGGKISSVLQAAMMGDLPYNHPRCRVRPPHAGRIPGEPLPRPRGSR